MLKSLSVVVLALSLLSCTSSTEQKFMAMNDAELAQYNASLPELKQIVCEERVRRGTVGLVRKVCTTRTRMARLTTGSQRDDRWRLNDPGLYGARSFNSEPRPVSRIFFSPPPPGYDQPIIHVLDNRR